MNVLQVVPQLNAGGVERTTIEIAQALTANGHGPHVASEGGRLEEELNAAGGILHRLNMGSKNPLSLRKNTRALITLIKTHNIDIIHARSRAPAWAAKAAANAANIPFITTYHGIYNAKSKLKRRYNAIMTKGDYVIANSSFTKEHILKEHGIAPDKITVIPRGVDMQVFDPALIGKQAIQTCRKNWGIDQNLPVLLLPGRLTRWKGQLIAIKALSLLQESMDAYLVLLGDAQGREDYVEEIKLLIQSFGLQERVKIASHTSDMATAYGAANIVVSASTDPEAFGRVAAEAQAMETFVVASKHGGALETVLDGQTGCLTTPGDAQALANGVANILSWTPPLLDKRKKVARKHIQRSYSADAMKSATIAVYEIALKSKGDK